jgi:serine phosphatase RsbU (regulator of sigma subunit)
VSRGDATTPSLVRILPRREIEALLDALAPLLPGSRLVVRDAAGGVVAERAGDLPGALRAERDERPEGSDGLEPTERRPAAPATAGTWHAPVRLGDMVVGSLDVAGPPVGDLPTRARIAAALHDVLQQALAAGSVRRALVTEALERYREVNVSYRLGEVLAAGFDLEALSERALVEAVRVVRATSALLVLDEADRSRIVAAWGVPVDDPSVLAALASSRAAPVTGGSAIHVDAGTSAGEHAIRLWAPLQARDRLLGGLLLMRANGQAVFSAGDAKLLAALAAQVASYVDNARLHRVAVEQARITRELQLAREVQARLMPSVLPSGDDWEIAAWWSAAREVAGDFYDATREGGTLAVTVGDVADKGMAAALFMALTRSVVRASTGGRGPAAVMTRANALLCADASDGMFVTLFHAHLGADGRVRYANGGHPPALAVRSDGTVRALGRTGVLLGWEAALDYGEADVELAPGDVLLLYTDGVTEARSQGGAEYGAARLEALASDAVRAGATAAALVGAIRADLAVFAGTAAPFDDATVLAARRRDGDTAGVGGGGPDAGAV